MIEAFENYLFNENVKKAQPNLALAKSLVKDMVSRFNDVSSLDINKFPKIVFENIYDALRDFADSLLSFDGFKSYSHEATFSYLEKYDFDKSSLFIFDKFRYKRNSSKYYGQIVLIEEAEEILEFYEKNRKKINKILEDKNLI